MGTENNSSKGTSCCRCITVTVAILLVASLAGNSFLTVFYSNIIPFTVDGVVGMFTDCASCPTCLTCLGTASGQDLNLVCDPFRNILQCAVQLIYLYGRPNYNQPCYNDCHKCQRCLNKTTFGQLGNLNQTLWESVYTDYLTSPEDLGIKEYSMVCSGNNSDSCKFQQNNTRNTLGRRKRTVTDLCCGTTTDLDPYLTNHTDISGTPWHPVWFYEPWKPFGQQYKLQFYEAASCTRPSPTCSKALGCTIKNTRRSFLMTSKVPSVPSWGYTLDFLVIPDAEVKFMTFELPGYCRCVTN